MYRKVGENEMVEHQYLDKRVQRSKQDFTIALFDLLEAKKYDQISIKDIIEKAGYSRGTFYSHYNHKDDLLFEFVKFLIDEMIKSFQASYINKDSLNIREFVNEPLQFLQHFKQYGRNYQILLGNNVRINFRQIITDIIINIYIEEFELISSKDKKEENQLLNRCMGYGLIGIILEWIMDDFPVEPEELSKQLVKMLQSLLGTVRIKRKNSPSKYFSKETIS